jgi:hypothetical protein
MQEAHVNISDTFGLWERSLIAWPDGGRDTTTIVAWLQGPSLFADLRQPANAPSFDGVSCLNDLRPRHLGWLARQEGFAGRLVCAGNAFEWRRAVDFQCPSASADAGYLEFFDGMLVEQGRDVPYTEHWHRASPVGSPHIAMQMLDQHGRVGFLVRAGEIFMYVRDREVLLPPGNILKDLVDAANPEAARALLDCEISLGSVHGSAWLIERSSLPYRVGDDLAPSFSTDEPNFTANDVSADGETCLRHWTVVDLDVDNQRHTAGRAGREEEEFFPLHAAARRGS